MKPQTLFAVVVGVFAGCSDPAQDPDAPVFDGTTPRVHIVSPARGAIAGDVTELLVTGTTSDEIGSVAEVTVNGVQAVIASDGTWSAKVTVAPGTNLLHAIAVDERRNIGEETRAVVVGPMRAIDGHVTNGIRASLSAQALSTLGSDAATYIEAGGLITTVQSMNPFVDAGGGPDCLYAQASITSLTVGDANVQLPPTNHGINVSAVLENVQVGMRLQWAVSCQAGTRDVVVTAQSVSVQGLLAIGVVDRKLDIQFDHPDVQITGLDVQLPDVPDTVVNMLALETTISAGLGLVTERLVVPMVDQALVALGDDATIDVAGTQVGVDVEPTQISFTAEGGTLALATSLRAHGDSGQFVFVPNPVPVFDMKRGFELAIADDAANQLLASLWSAKFFDTTIALEPGTYGKISGHYDSVDFQLAVPPHVVATGNPLELTIGDWIATFRIDGVPAATVAIHAQNALYVVERENGKLRMDVSTPSVDVDVIGQGDLMTKAQYDAIRVFALDRVRSVGSAAVAAIPLPVLGDATLTNLWLDPKWGYLLIDGDVE